MKTIEDITNNEEAFKFFEMTEEEISEIKKNLIFNNYWDMHTKQLKKIEKERAEAYANRFSIPFGKTKKEYREMLKFNQTRIDNCNDVIREYKQTGNEFIHCWEDEREKYIEKKEKIKFILSKPKNGMDINKAKSYPITSLLEFRNGFAKRCPKHSPQKDQDTPSLKYYKEKNTCFCFVCNQKFDSLDIYMMLYNVNLTEAVKKLSI